MNNDLVILSRSQIKAHINLMLTHNFSLHKERLEELLNKAQVVDGDAVYQVAINGDWKDTTLEFYVVAKGIKRTLFNSPKPAIPEGFQLVPTKLSYGAIREVLIKYFHSAGMGNSFLYDDFYAELLEAAKKEGGV